jgi:hypothetical protein
MGVLHVFIWWLMGTLLIAKRWGPEQQHQTSVQAVWDIKKCLAGGFTVILFKCMKKNYLADICHLPS